MYKAVRFEFPFSTVGVTGSIKSFNNGGEGTHLTRQQYSVCVRREKGYCSICWNSGRIYIFCYFPSCK